MPLISSFFLVLAVALAVVLGPQFRTFMWGPSLLALALAALAAMPGFLRRTGKPLELPILTAGIAVVAWFGWRAAVSPVHEFAIMDGLLLSAAVAGFLVMRTLENREAAGTLFHWGLAILLLASIGVLFKQVAEPQFIAVFREKSGKFPSGFFGHYSFGAHFLIAASLLLGGVAALGTAPGRTRILWGLIALGGLVGVFFTQSRGGYIGAGAGLLVWAVGFTLIGLRRKAKWAAPTAIILPIVCLIVIAIYIAGLTMAQEQRQTGTGITVMLDNDIRLYLLGVAASCIGLHPLAGGGARSFSWECYPFWDAANQGYRTTRPEHVHNEIVQAATDYGLLGAGLLLILLLTALIPSVLRCWLDDSPTSRQGDGWRLGGLAALSGILVHSAFEGVLRTVPGALMFGIALAACCHSTGPTQPKAPLHPSRRWLPAAVLLAVTVWMIPNSWTGTRIYQALWHTHYSKTGANSDESKIEALTAAIHLQPTAELLIERATAYQRLSVVDPQDPVTDERIALAIADYRRAATLHPYNAIAAINLANLLSLIGEDTAAETEYARTLELQGGMEGVFPGHWSLSSHLLKKGLRQFRQGLLKEAAASLEQAASEAEKSFLAIGYPSKFEQRITIHENLGAVHEAMGDPTTALRLYNFATTIPGGARAHYRAGALLAKRAGDLWSQRRPAEALFLYQQALQRVSMDKSLPEGVTPSAKVDLVNHLRETIAFLQGAGIQPVEPKAD
jgi:O-antigen ligase